MSKKVMKIGVVGFSRNQFDKKKSREILRQIFVNLRAKHHDKEIHIVSGYTNSGIPKIAYELAEEFGFVTVGYSAKQALSVRSGVYPVKEVIIRGTRFGDESVDFVNYLDGLIRIGGGAQSRNEVELFKARHSRRPLQSLLKEYEIEWYGTPPNLSMNKLSLPDMISKIEGLQLLEEFITQKDHDLLIRQIDEEIWSNELKRRVQHYGYKYNYRSRSIDETMKVGELPIWVNKYVERMVSDKLMSKKPDQLIVNEYLPGQGIANHVDCEPCFGDTIISISLGSKVIMNLTNLLTKEIIPLVLEPRSALLLKGASRYNWMHGIIGRKTDVINDVKWKRTRRISLTFRKVILARE